jgi:dienelactone hydrolase
MSRGLGRLALNVGVALLAIVALSGAIDPPPESPIGGEPVRFETEDGVAILGHMFRPRGTPKGGILFVHEPFRSQRDWAYLAEKASRQGFVALVFDLRGHGESLMRGDEELDREIFMDEDFAAMALDIKAALNVLRAEDGVDAEQIHLVGSDLGGSLCLLEARDDPGVRSLAMLSPGLGYDGINIVGQVNGLGDRPLLMVYSVEDGYARKSVEVINKEARGPVHVETYYGVGHGTKMLSREPKLEQLMTAWFLGTVISIEGNRLEDAGKPMTEDVDVDGVGLDADAERQRLEEARREADEAQAGAIEDDEDEDKGRRWELEEKK